MLITEKTLAEGCLRGDRNAQKQLYETYSGFMLGLCLRYVGDQPTAEDLMHDCFIHVLTHFDQYRWQGEGSLKSWLLTIQRNLALAHLRKNDELKNALSIEDNLTSVDMPEPETIRDIPRQKLLQLIAELPVGYRTVFNMHVIDGLPHKEIANLLGIHEKSSSSQLLHARRLLAEKINKWRNENL